MERSPWRPVVYLILIIGVIVSLFPFYWMVRSAMMTREGIFSSDFFPGDLHPENYKEALTKVPFLLYFRNTFTLVCLNLLGNLASSSFAAFGFSRIVFPGRNFFFGVLLTTMMIPGSVLLIPQFIGWKEIGAYNTLYPLFAASFFGSAFFIFLLRQFFSGIPKEYDESAFMDGANYLTIYWRLILPMSKPALTAVGVFTFMAVWNDFFGPLIYLNNRSLYTLSLGLQSFMAQYNTEWNLIMAASSVIILPTIIMFYAAQKAFIEGATLSGIKG
jgi:multiple sugar transport system permease protein